MKDEVFISLDIESDGPVPGLNSMLALGAAAFHSDGTEMGVWYATLFPLEDASQDPETMTWWKSQPEAWEEVNGGQRRPDAAIPEFTRWLSNLRDIGRLTAVAWPASFDFPYINYYCHRFAGGNPLGFSCLDTRSYMNGLARYPSYQGFPIRESRKMTGHIDKTGLRPHVAVDDAVEQGRTFMALRHWALENGVRDDS